MNIKIDITITFANDPTGSAAADSTHAEIINELLPIFKGHRAVAEEFLQAIQGAMPVAVTALVNQLDKEGAIMHQERFKPLWQVLHNHGLYDRTNKTWNHQVE